jgi:hypothetical protein
MVTHHMSGLGRALVLVLVGQLQPRRQLRPHGGRLRQGVVLYKVACLQREGFEHHSTTCTVEAAGPVLLVLVLVLVGQLQPRRQLRPHGGRLRQGVVLYKVACNESPARLGSPQVGLLLETGAGGRAGHVRQLQPRRQLRPHGGRLRQGVVLYKVACNESPARLGSPHVGLLLETGAGGRAGHVRQLQPRRQLRPHGGRLRRGLRQYKLACLQREQGRAQNYFLAQARF